jgi:very-short-patch-repair endonuclease
MWRLLRDHRLAQLNFAGKFPSKILFLVLSVSKNVSSSKIDGSQHADSKRDTAREAVLLAEGFRIARYWNNDVLQRHTSVLEDVLTKLSESDS